ncbi:SMI1/KNR4 family protein [Pyxidicoccus fallax]|uniref:SMI1/KNR4 family protein n=1 Tax=Pyxidicoccus fallax TaxID=394095 RepID=A0A848LXL6_9BACT|nr:SMI1/KNR4 family protein [Pyxidicoccus fallax]NMO22340.1 SMI1/KNR4 family protein [Pyxidicoccus fallax]NPC85307.1 SMI1/KNR4 family protein [Pyxidicoccus fallax]
MSARLVQVRRKLGLLRQRDTALEVEGASHHRYKLGPRLSDAALRGWEARHQVTLPEEYRAFLMELGNGGAGPSYGLRPLKEDTAPTPGTFPLSRAEAEARVKDPVDEEGDFLEPPYENSPPAALWICDHGCGEEDWLIVRGDLRGGVWHTGDSHFAWFDLETFRLYGFLDWYEDWLDEELGPFESPT